MTMSCESALHMSYTQSAAADAPASASISTPVLWLTRTAHSTRSREDSVLLRSIFVAVTVNTGVIFALANFSPLTGHGYAHFSRGWYDEIGAPIALRPSRG